MSNRALIVENDPGTIELLKAHLAEVSDHIQVLTDSRQVEQVFKDFEPDIVVLNLHMPDPDGLEVLRRLRSARESLGYLPVVVLTGDTSKVARNAALILGADDFLTKPLDQQEVVLRVRNLLHTRHLFEEARAVAGRRFSDSVGQGSRLTQV